MDRNASMKVVAEIARETRLPVVLPPHATVLSVSIEPWYEATSDTIMVTFDIYEVVETIRESRFVKHGMRIVSFTADETGHRGFTTKSITVWDDDEDFSPFTINKIGRIETPQEYAARRDWEAMQYRVGTLNNPLDNADRTAEGHTTASMQKHWK